MPSTTFVNCRVCRNGRLIPDQRVVVDSETGRIGDSTLAIESEIVDLDNAIVAPGFLELQMNGLIGFHFSNFESDEQYERELARVAARLVERGVTGFWATLPTVEESLYHKILPSLKPCEISNSASLLGAHVEGPYLHASKAGAHTPDLFKDPSQTLPSTLYGGSNLAAIIKLVTLAPELEGSNQIISLFTSEQIRVSLGHSTADYNIGLQALDHGATALTHVFNAMSTLLNREPGLAGLIASDREPYFSLIADNVHLHPATLAMAYRANPARAILITDSLEVGGLPDGVHPGNAQISHAQEKRGDRVTLAGTNTLIGGCAGLDQCVRNLSKASGCDLAEAVRCVTENIADMMGEKDRGEVQAGKRADLVILNDDGHVLQTWVSGRKVWG